jgi:uncharacterized membrane-anchored protein
LDIYLKAHIISSIVHSVAAIVFCVPAIIVYNIEEIYPQIGQDNFMTLLMLAALCLIVTLLSLIAAIGAYFGKTWGKVLSGISTLALVFLFPIGTIFAVILFYHSDWTDTKSV